LEGGGSSKKEGSARSRRGSYAGEGGGGRKGREGIMTVQKEEVVFGEEANGLIRRRRISSGRSYADLRESL